MSMVNNFMLEAITKISRSFPNALIEYQHNSDLDTHYIKVTPPWVNENDKLIDIAWELKDSFDEKFSSGNICFLTENSLIELDAPSIVYVPQTKLHVSPFRNLLIDTNTILSQFESTIDFEWSENSKSTAIESDTSLEVVACINAGNYDYAMAA